MGYHRRMDERRRHRRVAFKLPVALHLGHGQPRSAFLMDLAEGGAFLMMETAEPVGETARLTFRVGNDICQASGRVLRIMPFAAGQGVALELTERNNVFVNFVRNLASAADPLRWALVGDIEDVVAFIE